MHVEMQPLGPVQIYINFMHAKSFQISWQEQMLHCMLLKRQGNNGSELFYFSHDRDGSHDKMSRRQLDHKTEQHELEPREPIAYSPIW